MRFAVPFLLALAACRSEGPGSGTQIVVAYAGDQPAAGVTVIGHAPDGTIIDEQTADAVGRAAVGVDEDSLISVVFPASIKPITPVISIVTTPIANGDIIIHGPGRDGPPPLIVGVLELDGPNLQGADFFDVTLGCATVRVPSLPAQIDVGACSMGSDTNLDVLVRAYQGTTFLGYAAGRVKMQNGLAPLELPAWQTTHPSVPVTLQGVLPDLDWTLHVDGLPFVTETFTNAASLYSDLAVDATTVRATITVSGGAQVTIRETAGTPTAIAFTPGDFLPALAPSLTSSQALPLTATWNAEPTGADVIDLRATWEVGTDGRRVIWDAVLPADAIGVSFPRLGSTLGELANPASVAPADVMLRHVDSPELDGFAALVAAGIHAEDRLTPSSIAPRPVDGQLRTTYTVAR